MLAGEALDVGAGRRLIHGLMEGAAELATLPKESYGRWAPIVKEIGFAADLVAALKEAH